MESEIQGSNTLTQVYREMVVMKVYLYAHVCDQSIGLHLPAEIIDNIVSQMNISMLYCFNV